MTKTIITEATGYKSSNIDYDLSTMDRVSLMRFVSIYDDVYFLRIMHNDDEVFNAVINHAAKLTEKELRAVAIELQAFIRVQKEKIESWEARLTNGAKEKK